MRLIVKLVPMGNTTSLSQVSGGRGTRLQPVLKPGRRGDWNALLAEVLPDRTQVERAVRDQKMVLVFELWGYRNASTLTITGHMPPADR